MSDIAPVIDAVRRFRHDAEQAGQRVVAWPTIDPTFRIARLEEEGAFVLIYGTDDRGRDAMLIVPAAQLGLCMVSEPGEPEQGSFGFVPPRRGDA
jgi:hypothetical protein